jgi:hypothetical protein
MNKHNPMPSKNPANLWPEICASLLTAIELNGGLKHFAYETGINYFTARKILIDKRIESKMLDLLVLTADKFGYLEPIEKLVARCGYALIKLPEKRRLDTGTVQDHQNNLPICMGKTFDEIKTARSDGGIDEKEAVKIEAKSFRLIQETIDLVDDIKREAGANGGKEG